MCHKYSQIFTKKAENKYKRSMKEAYKEMLGQRNHRRWKILKENHQCVMKHFISANSNGQMNHMFQHDFLKA